MPLKRLCSVVTACVALFVLPAVCLHAQEGKEIVVSAAISLKDAFGEMGAAYERQTGTRVRLNLGASGLLQKQIEAGAPVDVFASAGMKQMDALQAAGLIDAATRTVFARNSLVLVVPSGSKLVPHAFSELIRPEIARLAIGNPKTVPAGQYAEQALKSMKLWERLQPRLVPAENVRQVLEYVSRGEVDAGFVYASDVPISRGKAVIAASAPPNSHDPILYPIAVVKDSSSKREAAAFIDLVVGAAGQAIMEKYGFISSR